MARYPLSSRVEDPRRMTAETLGQIRSDVNSDPWLSRGIGLLRQQSLRTADYHHHDHQTDDDLLRGGEPHARQERDHILGEATSLEQAEEYERAEERAAVVAAAAEDEREPDVETLLRQKHVRLDVREIVSKQDAGEPRHAGAEREGLHLEAEDRLAGDGGDDLVLADRAKHTAERRAAHALERGIDEPDRDQHEQQVEELIVAAEPSMERARNPGHAVRTAREPRLVQEK